MDLLDCPDRLIVCVHHPSSSEEAGLDLYNDLREQGVSWDELDSAVVEEYLYFGKRVTQLDHLLTLQGLPLFPDEKNGS